MVSSQLYFGGIGEKPNIYEHFRSTAAGTCSTFTPASIPTEPSLATFNLATKKNASSNKLLVFFPTHLLLEFFPVDPYKLSPTHFLQQSSEAI